MLLGGYKRHPFHWAPNMSTLTIRVANFFNIVPLKPEVHYLIGEDSFVSIIKKRGRGRFGGKPKGVSAVRGSFSR